MNRTNSNALLVAVALVLIGVQASAQTILGPGLGTGRTAAFNQTTNVTLSHGSGSPTGTPDYILTGLYFVDSLATLTINAGTVIGGDVSATLTIRPGGRIVAIGTSSSPIVFTSTQALADRAPGDWGGVIILGNAPVNQLGYGRPQIEGGIIPGGYGGNISNDNSGNLQYVRIEYAGYRFQINNEINGLTMGGVGSGTTIDHVQVSYAYDDSFEWFGGTVNCKYLVAFAGTDDDFDTDWGFSGKLQYGVGLRHPYVWDPTGQSHGFESDNEDNTTGNLDQPYTSPVFANFTDIGPQFAGPGTGSITGNNFQYVLVLRRNTHISVYNSAFCGYPGGYSWRNSSPDTVQYNSLTCTGDGGYARYSTAGGAQADQAAVQTHWENGTNTAAVSGVGASTFGFTNISLSSPNFLLLSSSPLLRTNGATLKPLKSVSSFFDTVAYRGAFGTTGDWTAGWTSFPQLGTSGTSTVSYVANNWNMVSVPRIPNAPATSFTVAQAFPSSVSGSVYSFDTPSGGYVSATSIVPGLGYWVLYGVGGPFSTTLTGQVLQSAVTPNITWAAADTLAKRWALVGSPTRVYSVGGGVDPINTFIVSSKTRRLVVNSCFEYVPGSGYQKPTTIAPGKAYWVLCNGGSAVAVDPQTGVTSNSTGDFTVAVQ